MSEAVSTTEFVKRVVEEYVALYDEIEEGDRKEADLVPRIVRHLFINALGFRESDYEQENDWNDVRFYNDERNPVIILEGKKRAVSAEEGIDQAFRYASKMPYTRYLIATNLDNLLVYERCSEDDPAVETRYGVSARLLTEIEVEGIVNAATGTALVDALTLDQVQAIQQLTVLQRHEIHDVGRYENFAFDGRQDVSTDTGFRNLLDSLSTCLDEYFMPYTLSAFDLFSERYREFEREATDLEDQIDRLTKQGHDDTEIAELETQLVELRDEYEPYRQFWSDFQTWVRLSNRGDSPADENKRVFCRESVYVQVNKILLVRIAEDKDLTNRMISNGGVTDYFAFWDDYTRYTKRDYTDLFDLACEELSEVYESLYTQQIFDWELHDDHGLDQVIQRTFWHLNHYDFTDVDRDVLGHLYEEHLPPEERKELGEFYTPTAVVDLILDRVGYTPDQQLERPENDLLDPACGSGTFLVRAAGRLLERLDRKGVPPHDAIEIVQERLHGFDLNPFACHIAEMNLLFLVMDLYREVKERDPEYTLGRFNVYQTDSLRRQTQISLTGLGSDALQRQYQKERREADDTKSREDFGFVVGNPPYVRIQNIPEGPAKEDYGEYTTAHYNYDLYVLFVEKAADWLVEGGELGFIISNKFVQVQYGEKLREFVPQNYRLKDIVNFGDIDVFESAKSFPVIFISERINKDERERSVSEYEPPDYEFTYAKVTETLPELIAAGAVEGWDAGTNGSQAPVLENGGGNEEQVNESEQYRITDLIARYLPETVDGEVPVFDTDQIRDLLGESDGLNIDLAEQPPVESFAVNSAMIADEGWRFVPAQEGTVMEAIETNTSQLATFCHGEKVERGLRTGANSVFVVTESAIDEHNIESELVRPLLGAEQVERWATRWEDRYILYMTGDTELEDYPRAKEYLSGHRETLEDRWCVKNGGKSWFELDSPKQAALFERQKIVSPDLCLYNNFCLDSSEEFYCLDSTYYVLPESIDEQYLVGILNSDVVQFYLRRTAPTYKDDYLRYKSGYLSEVPIPDQEEICGEIVDTVVKTAQSLQDTVVDYQKAKDILDAPSQILEQEHVETDSLSYAGYIDRLKIAGDSNDAEIHPHIEKSSVQLNEEDSIEFVDSETAADFVELLSLLPVETVGDVRSFAVPVADSDLSVVLDEYAESKETVEASEDRARALEDELNQAVCEAYELDEETAKFIRERVKRPTNPLEPKVMK